VHPRTLLLLRRAMDLLPLDLWRHVAEAGALGQRDLAALSCTCRELRAVGKALNCERGLRVSQRSGHFDAQAWRDLAALEVVGCGVFYVAPRAQDAQAVVTDLWRLRGLRRLTLHNAELPAAGGLDGLWDKIFRGCPRLEDVQVYGGFRMRKYGSDVAHYMDLVRLGAPRLRSLDIEGGWLVLYPTLSAGYVNTALNAASVSQIDRMLAMPPTPSTTLRHYRCASHQTPLGVDAPLESLCVDEPSVPPLALARMGDLTRRSVRDLTWSASWRVFDGRLLEGFSGLRACSLTMLGSSTSFARVAAAVDSLRHLPDRLERLSLNIETWCVDDAFGDDYEPPREPASWPRPLGHLRRLRQLGLELTTPTRATPALLGEWLGAGSASLETASVSFWEAGTRRYEMELIRLQEENDGEVDENDDYVAELHRALSQACAAVEAPGLVQWLDAHPGVTATVSGMPTLATRHPRLLVQRGRSR
jgi:hypothetical protein